MRAVCYARVSSAGQRDRDTIESQMRVLPEFVDRHGWSLVRPVETYVDDGRTAKAGHLEARTGFAAMLRDAALGVFDVVVVIDVDRLTRSEDLAERGAILGALQKAGVKVASAISGQVLDLSTSTGDLFTSLHAFFAAEWSRKHRERVTQGKITAIKRGRKPAGSGPWWLKCDKVTGAWSVDPIRAALVREMFERVAAGDSCRLIADDFHRRGVPRPRKEWSRHRIARMLGPRTAVGQWTIDRKRGLIIEVPPVVDEDLWQRAQAALAVSGRRGLNRTRHEYLLCGLVTCGVCGEPMYVRTREWDPRRNGRYTPAGYICKRRRFFRSVGDKCLAKIVDLEKADSRAWEALRIELEDPSLADALAREMAGKAEESDQWRDDADRHRAHLDRLERVEATILERFRRGLVSDAGLDLELTRLSREREAVRTQLATSEQAQTVMAGVRDRLDDAKRILTRLRDALAAADFKTRRQLVELLIPVGGVVLDGDSMKITMLVPRSSEAGGTPGLVGPSTFTRSHETHLRIRVVA